MELDGMSVRCLMYRVVMITNLFTDMLKNDGVKKRRSDLHPAGCLGLKLGYIIEVVFK